MIKDTFSFTFRDISCIFNILLKVDFFQKLIAIAGEYFEGDMELTEEQKIAIQRSIDGIPTYGATNYQNWPKRIHYAIDKNLGKYSLFST